MISTQQVEFQNRIQRIQAGTGSTKATVFVGQDLRFSYVPKNRRQHGAVGEVAQNAGYALSFPASLIVGVLSHVLYLYTEWVLQGVPQAPKNVDAEMIKVALAGVSIAILISHLLGLRDRALLVPKLLGVAVGMLFFHNLVHMFPQLFETVFSPIWVAKITSMTEPHSLFFRGVSFAF